MPRPPKPIGPLVKDQKAYASAIEREIISPLFEETFGRLAQAARAKQAYIDTINDIFHKYANDPDFGVDIAKRAVESFRLAHRERFIRSFRAAVGVDISPMLSELGLRGMMEASLAENIALIKSIPQELNAQILSKVSDVFETKGFDQQAIVDVMQGRFNVSKSRAKLIARDQNNKIIGNLNQARQTQIGVREYIWQTVSDERVRESHAVKNGQKFLWSSPPLDTGHPGEDINCRCVPIMVLPPQFERAAA